MKPKIIFSIIILINAFLSKAQLSPQINWETIEQENLVELHLMNHDVVLFGHLFKATADSLHFLKKANYLPDKYQVVNLLVTDVKKINFPNQSKRSHFLGAVVGGSIGALAGGVWANSITVPACEPTAIFFCSNSEERQAARRKQFNRYLGTTLAGTVMGALIGIPIKKSIPIGGNKRLYEHRLSKIKANTILK